MSSWWTRFHDAILTDLTQEALRGNLSIIQGVARLRQARAALGTAQAERLPTFSSSGVASRNLDSNGGLSSNFGLTTTASWEADLFGGQLREIEASQAEFEAAGYELHAVQVSVAAEVALNYVLARAGQERMAIARENLTGQDESLQIVQWRVQAGLSSSLDAEQARAQRAQTAATVPALDANIANAVNRIAILIGKAPGAVNATMRPRRPISSAPDRIAVGIPADTLSQRPDVRRAERGLAAATARIGATEARLYPALRLSGNIGTSALAAGSAGGAVAGALIASVAAPLFDGGRIRQQIAIRTAQQETAFVAYRQAVMTALEEIESALTAVQSARRRQATLTIAVDASRNAVLLARSRYRSGLTDFTTLLEAQRTLLSAQNELAGVKVDRATALIQLYRALGGGWTPTDPSVLLQEARHG